MFAKAVVFATTLVALAAAWDPQSSGCSTGNVQCCTSTTSEMTPDIQGLLASQGWTGGNPPLPLGLDCSPLDLLNLGGNVCNSETVCCENNHMSGLIVVGCSPINVFL